MARVDLAGRLEDARARVEAEAPTEERGLAKFARLTRKDTRIRADQDAALAALGKSLMRRRSVKAERITENTLIRVAIDLLLAHADELRGSTEDELRDSVTAALADFHTSGLPQFPHHGGPESRGSELPESTTSAVSHPDTSEGGKSRSPRPIDRRTGDVGTRQAGWLASDPVVSPLAARGGAEVSRA